MVKFLAPFGGRLSRQDISHLKCLVGHDNSVMVALRSPRHSTTNLERQLELSDVISRHNEEMAQQHATIQTLKCNRDKDSEIF